MKIDDPQLRAEFRAAYRCECCGRPAPNGCDPAHIFSKGAGQVDIRENLVSLLRKCHNLNHAGLSPTRAQLLFIAARRENTTPDDIEDKVKLIIRTPKPIGYKDMTPQQLREYAERKPTLA